MAAGLAPARRPDALATAISLENGHISAKFDNPDRLPDSIDQQGCRGDLRRLGDEFDIRAEEFGSI